MSTAAGRPDTSTVTQLGHISCFLHNEQVHPAAQKDNDEQNNWLHDVRQLHHLLSQSDVLALFTTGFPDQHLLDILGHKRIR